LLATSLTLDATSANIVYFDALAFANAHAAFDFHRDSVAT
jgi:hypothetical protein